MLKVFMLYEVNPTTWFYLSLLMITGIFFKFRRIWSVRNLDLFLLLSLGPGLLMIAHDFYAGYIVIFSVLLLLMTRMLCDPMMIRRPLLEVNLSKSGLIFCCAALMFFQIAGLVLTQTREGSEDDVNSSLEQLMMFHLNERVLKAELEREAEDGLPAGAASETRNVSSSGQTAAAENAADSAHSDQPVAQTSNARGGPLLVSGPGMPFFTKLTDFPRRWRYERLKKKHLEALEAPSVGNTESPGSAGSAPELTLEEKYPMMQLDRLPFFPVRQIRWTILLATLAQAGIVVGIVMTGWAHFENFNTGIAAATLYLLLPYVSQMPSRLDHLIPAALIVWAVFSWRLPSLAGVLLGFAAALSYYPIFLLPLWCSFYWSRGLYRFLITSLGTFLFLMCLAIPLAGGWGPFWAQSGDIFGCIGLFSRSAAGLWDLQSHSVFYRIPVIALYLMFVFFLTFWPSQKNVGTLMSSSAALMLGAQFCHPFQGGTYLAWFLPLAILIIFRPNLEDRTAIRAIGRHRRRPAIELRPENR